MRVDFWMFGKRVLFFSTDKPVEKKIDHEAEQKRWEEWYRTSRNTGGQVGFGVVGQSALETGVTRWEPR
jgi:hypothetical protein